VETLKMNTSFLSVPAAKAGNLWQQFHNFQPVYIHIFENYTNFGALGLCYSLLGADKLLSCIHHAGKQHAGKASLCFL